MGIGYPSTRAARRAGLRAAFLLLAALAGVGAPAGEVIVETGVMIPMRDGIRLATDIYRPATDGVAVADPLPVLLTRSPYGKDRQRDVDLARYLASHGYVAAIQDIRGRYASEGEFTKYSSLEAPDGYDTVEWLARQPWSDGRVGMWGTSYAAHAQADAAKLAPPSLKAMLLNEGGMADAWDHAVRHGGAFELGRELTWAWRQIPLEIDDPVVRRVFEQESITDWYQALPFRAGQSPLAIAPEYEAYFLEEMTRSDYSDYWKNIALNWKDHYDATADAAMLHVGGWYDIFLRGTIENYVALSAKKSSRIELLIGPWTHSGNTRTYAGDVDFGPAAAIEDFHGDFHRRWFDRHLKGVGAGDEAAPIRLFLMGTGDGGRDAAGRLRHGGYWFETASWPPPGAEPAAFYLQVDGSLDRRVPTERNSSTTYTFDPADPVPTIGGNVSARVGDGAFDQRERADFPPSAAPWLPLAARPDVLVFQTAPLTEDVVVAGPIEVVLWASSTARDTDFSAKLVDVYPPGEDYPGGFAMNISDALLRASYREDRLERDLIEPGRVYRFVIRPFPTANVFREGHRIRLDISSSNFPRFDVNPNTGEPLGQNRRRIAADNTVFHDRRRPSHIVLSVLPARPPIAQR
ncbi:MAG: CocE/NonD family hydrolase [Gammaproteobacteria bacterium]|nr:CocE/NonD family hydrolase [Gammaproteobacteria bacterium]